MVTGQTSITEWSTHAELTLWVVDEWRCEVWLVDGTQSLQLFRHEHLAREIRILPHRHHDALALADRWKTLVTERHRCDRNDCAALISGRAQRGPQRATSSS
jgi:hypothetical protein